MDLGQLPPLTADDALALYRAAQEGITNALRHGRARQLTLELQRGVDQLTLTVEDDGEGLATDWKDRPGHHGLRWLAERVLGQGGRLLVENAASRGVRLTVVLPLAQQVGMAA